MDAATSLRAYLAHNEEGDHLIETCAPETIQEGMQRHVVSTMSYTTTIGKLFASFLNYKRMNKQRAGQERERARGGVGGVWEVHGIMLILALRVFLGVYFFWRWDGIVVNTRTFRWQRTCESGLAHNLAIGDGSEVQNRGAVIEVANQQDVFVTMSNSNKAEVDWIHLISTFVDCRALV